MPIMLKVKRRGMPHSSAQLVPRGCDRTVCKLDQIERVLHIFIDLIQRSGLARVEFARHTAVQDRQRLAPMSSASTHRIQAQKTENNLALACGRTRRSTD